MGILKENLSIILPVEVQHREFLAKLHLATAAAAQGAHVIVGDQQEIARRLAQMPRSIYLDKSIAKTKLSHFKRLRKFGHLPVALCEEGLTYRDAAAYQRERICKESFGLISRFFMWGKRQHSHVVEVLGDDPKLSLTGNPRFDLLRSDLRPVWQSQVDVLRAEYGRFIIINSSFSRANRMPGTPDVVELLRARGTLGGDEQIEFYRGWINHLNLLKEQFIKMLPVLARSFPNHLVVLRPHPSEDQEVWCEAANGISNLRVVHEGSVIPWLIAAEAVIHNSCTTGVEAWLLDRPVFAYQPIRNTVYDSELPNALSLQFDELTDLIDALKEVLAESNGAARDKERLRIAKDFIEATSGLFAADRILGELPPVGAHRPSWSRSLESARESLKRLARRVPGMRPPESIRMLKKQKFPGIRFDEVRNDLAVLTRLRPEFDGVQCAPLGSTPNTFRIWRPQ